MLQNIFLAFIPIFVAVDAFGVLPVFISLTEGCGRKEKSRIIFQSVWTALCLAVSFIFLGKVIFKFLGITISDFMIAGGAILFAIAMRDILSPAQKRRRPVDGFGPVPIGTPLIVGPAVLTTSLMIIAEYGLYPVLLSVFINIVIAGMVFYFSHFLIQILGKSGSQALSKVTSLLLAAIAVMMIRKGILQGFCL